MTGFYAIGEVATGATADVSAVAGTATLLGIFAAFSAGIGVASGKAISSAVGVQAQAAIGTVAASGSAPAVAMPLGVAAIGSVGLPFASGGAPGVAAPAGVSAITSIGQPLAAAGAKVAPAGVTSSTQVGSATATGGALGLAAPAGVVATVQVGTTSATGGAPGTAMPAGVSASIVIGAVAVAASGGITVVGVMSTASVNIVTATGGGAGVAQPAGVRALCNVGQASAAGYADVLAGGIAAFVGTGLTAANGEKNYTRAPTASGYSHRHRDCSDVVPRLRQLSAPIALAVSLNEAKDTLRVERDDTSLEPVIARWLRGVTAEAEHTTGRLFINRPMRATLDGFSGALRLASPLVSVEDVAYIDAAGALHVLDPQDFVIDMATEPGYLMPAPGKAWPETAAINSVTVDFVAGYGDDDATVPDCAQLYILARLAEQWEPQTREFRATSQSEYLTRLLDPLKVYQ